MKNIKFQVNKSEKKILLVLILFLVFAYILFFHFFPIDLSGFTFYDYKGQWRINAIAIRGVDPYTQISISNPSIVEIGAVPKGFGTSPWGFILGNLFYPGFLSLATAKIYFVCFSLAVLIYTSVMVYIKIKDNTFLKPFIFALFTIVQISFWASLQSGNAGMLCCCFIIISCLINENHPYFAGLLLAFSMIKPQSALLVCITLLLYKKLLPLIVAAVVDLAAFIAACFMVKRTPICLLEEFLKSDIGEGKQNCGIFNFLHSCFGLNSMITMLLSMAFCTVLTIILVLTFKKYHSDLYPTWYVYFIPCVITTFWSYSWGNENFIHIIPCMICFSVLFSSNNNIKTRLFALFFFFYFFFDYTITNNLLVYCNNLIRIFSPSFAIYITNKITLKGIYDWISFFILIISVSPLYMTKIKRIGVTKHEE